MNFSLFLEMDIHPQDPSIQSSKQNSSTTLSSSILPNKLLHIANAMHNTLSIHDRSYGSKIYSSCFTAASAIDWLLINGHVESRKEGIQLCKELVSNHIIQSVIHPTNDFTVIKE